MDARSKMIEYREKRKLSFYDLSDKCGVSAGLISMIERGHVTHPNIVKKLKKLYSLTDIEAEELLPENRRKHGNDYDPDRYVSPVDRQICLNPDKPKEKDIEYAAYMAGKSDRFS